MTYCIVWYELFFFASQIQEFEKFLEHHWSIKYCGSHLMIASNGMTGGRVIAVPINTNRHEAHDIKLAWIFALFQLMTFWLDDWHDFLEPVEKCSAAFKWALNKSNNIKIMMGNSYFWNYNNDYLWMVESSRQGQ